MDVPRISVVIPAYNEERYLPRLLATLQVARGSRPDIEVIVADNGSRDGTVAIARASGCRVVHAIPRRIGAVRNAGAREARGAILAFVDADFQVHPASFTAIDAFFADPRCMAAMSGAVPERRSLPIDLSWLMLGALTAAAGYGLPRRFAHCMPSGLVCCRHEDWVRVGGYAEERLFLEDVRFVLDLQDLGRREGRRCGWLRDCAATCSTRKFDLHGDWHYLTLAARMTMWRALDPAALARWARRYWYEPQR
jgi:glycosyltransferase involved in cell wall biosynthesis